VRDVQADVLELRAQGPAGNAQQEGSPLLIAAGVLQDAREHDPIQLAVDLPVQVTGVGAKPLAEERLEIEGPLRGPPRPRRARRALAGVRGGSPAAGPGRGTAGSPASGRSAARAHSPARSSRAAAPASPGRPHALPGPALG